MATVIPTELNTNVP